MDEREKIYENLRETVISYLKWTGMGIATGVLVGLFATVFAYCLQYATVFREAHSYTFLALPLGGILIVFLYKRSGMEKDTGTDNVIKSIEQDVLVPFRLAFLIFCSTAITIFCGGSVGREGAALQMGASLGNGIGRVFRFSNNDKRIMIMSGMSAAFGALFQTPMAAAFFTIEVASIGMMHYAALVPCILAALTAYSVIRFCGIPAEIFPIPDTYALNISFGWRVLVLATLCAVLSIAFCVALQLGEKLMREHIPNKYIRIIIGSFLLVGLNLAIGSSDYQGTGMKVIEEALSGNAHTFAFLLKLLFTVITISAGFKGGEIVPSFFIGATFGCVVAGMLGLPVQLCAAIGMVSVFCGVTNCPVASLLISIELFGIGNVYYFLLAIATSYMLSGYFSLYHTQTIVFAKNEERHIGRKVGRLFSR